jgi:diacylglycerol O-acyltransferase / wax synthase
MSTHTMSSADAAWLHMDRPTNLMVINSLLWFDRPIALDDLRAIYAERIVGRFDRFSQLAVEGATGPHWEDVEVDLDLHLHHVALPWPGDRAALEALVADRIAMPLDRARPPWEVYLIDGFGDGCAVLSRMHHSIADGIALARVMLTLADGADDGPFTHGGRRGSLLGTVAHGTVSAALHPRRTLHTAVEDAQTLAKLLVPGADPPSAIKGDQHIAHHVAWSDPVDLWRVKRTARALHATVNDVVVAAVSAAIGDYVAANGDEPDRLRALVPFNLRPLDEPLPRDLGNRFGLVLLELPIAECDPIDRVAAVKQRMDAIKHGHEGPIAYGILELMGLTPAPVEARLIDYFTAKGSLVLTNVPGPSAPICVAGAKLKGVLVWAPCSGSLGMSVSVFSYAGKVTVGFLTDAGMVSDPQTLADGFREHLLALAREVRQV